MSTKRATKRALLTSILAICLCLVMLIGSTFAWFTDTASTGVNKIQSGKLDVDIMMKQTENNETKWVSAQGKTLSFRNRDGNTDILWEPGATFNLDTFKIVNNGNLALKYTVTITGAVGDAKLLDAIEFFVKKGTADPVELAGWDGILLPKDASTTGLSDEDAAKANVEETTEILIYGKMKESAGNDCMDKTLSGIAITVNATQYTYENDSFGNTYDANANGDPDHPDWTTVSADVEATVSASDVTTLKNAGETIRVTYPTGSIRSAINKIKLSVTETNAPANLAIPSDAASKSYAFKVVNADTGSDVYTYETSVCTVELLVGKGLSQVKLYAGNGPMTKKDAPAAKNEYKYDPATGMVTFCVRGFGENQNIITYVTDGVQDQLDNAENSAMIALTANKHYDTLYITKSVENLTIKGASGAVVDRICTSGTVTIKNLTIDGVNFVVSGSKNAAVTVYDTATVEGLTVVNCTMSPAAGATKARFISVTGSQQKDVVVEKCVVNDAYQAVTVNKITGLTVKENTFNNISGRDIMIMGVATETGEGATSGTVTITNNQSSGGQERFLRIGDASEMTLTVTGNIITNYRGTDDDYIKIDNCPEGAVINSNTATAADTSRTLTITK